MLEKLGPETELHVIDPIPEFDPAEHEQRFPGRYIFHRDVSHNVLPTLPPVDVALVDGDHNWFTVYHELKMLAEALGRLTRHFRYHARRAVAVRPSRPLLRARGPRRVPPAVRDEGGSGPVRRSAADRRPESRALQRGDRRGSAQRRHDRARRLHGRIRPAVAPARAPVYFGLAIVVEEELLDDRPRAGRVVRPSREHRDASRTDRTGGVHPTRRADPASGGLLDDLRPRGARRAPLPRAARAGARRPRSRGWPAGRATEGPPRRDSPAGSPRRSGRPWPAICGDRDLHARLPGGARDRRRRRMARRRLQPSA